MALQVLSEGFSLVIVGSQNPAIHHPLWYRNAGLITHDEMQHALADEAFSCLPVVAQFRTGTMALTCDSEKWIGVVQQAVHVDRLVQLAGAVFDKLGETPVGAFGFNCDRHVVSRCASVEEYFASRLADARLGLPDATPGSRVGLQIRYPREDGHFMIRVEQSSQDRAAVFCSTNHHRSCKNLGEEYSNFDLKAILERFVPQAIQESLRVVEGVVEPMK